MNSKFPLSVKSGSAVVKVYRVKHTRAASGFVYAVSYYVGPRRFLPQFAKLDDALREAKLRADLLAAGRHESAGVKRADADELKSARTLLDGVPLLSALQEWHRARALTDGQILAAAELWKSRNVAKLTRRKVSAVVDEFIAARASAGFDVGTHYASIFRAIKAELGESLIDAVSARQLSAYLEKLPDPSTRNTHRKRLVAVWRWAKRQGYLAREAITEAEQTERAKEKEAAPEIIHRPTLAALLEKFRNDPALLPALVLSCLCGLRRSEVHAQRWEDIHLDERFLRVSNAKAGTPSMRLVPLCDAAVEWLLLCPNRKGQITDILAVDRIRLLARAAKMELPENCFRHAFISHRVAQTGDISATSLEAGNSPEVIRRHYLKLVSKAEGEAWFACGPSTPASQPLEIGA